MNANQRQQLIDSLGENMIGYINHYNHLCDEYFFDVSDTEERIEFLNTMYDNYKDVDPELKTTILGCIQAAMKLAEQNFAIHKEQINRKKSVLDQFLCDKMRDLTVPQQDIVCKNYLYITALLKNDLMLVGPTTTPSEVDKSVGDKIRATTLTAIWQKITTALGACNNNSVRFRDYLLNILRAENQERRQQCDNMRNSFLNRQGNLVVDFAEADRRITGRQMQQVVDHNLMAIFQQVQFGGH